MFYCKQKDNGILHLVIILPFYSLKYFHSWRRLSNLVDLSFEYLSFSNKQKTTTLCGYKYDKTTLVIKKRLINDLTFRMPQHTSSEVTVGYNTLVNSQLRILHF